MSSRFLRLSALLLGVALISYCRAGEPKAPAPNLETTALARGKTIAAQTFAALSSNLTNALATGGISHALPFCAAMAAPLTASVAASNRVEVRRVSHRARNPSNRAAASELALITRFRADLEQGRTPAPVIVDSGNDSVVFFAPIVLQLPVCLQCHGQPGTDIRPENLALIQRLYPQDQATGFRLGDLRGLWRIKFRKADLWSPK